MVRASQRIFVNHLAASRGRRGGLVVLALAAVAGCGTYEPPRPGIHRGPGEPRAELVCTHEAPTGTRFAQLSCRRPETIAAQREAAREDVDNIRTTPHDIR